MKKIFLTALLMLVCAIGFADTWTDSEGNVWEFNITDSENHYVTLTGLNSGTNANVPGVVKVGEVDYYVRKIGEYAFNYADIIAISDLTHCVEIGDHAFHLPSNGGPRTIGNLPACTRIGVSAFSDCTTLTSVGDLSACTSIEEGAFWNCPNLSSIGDLSKCTSIGLGAFSGCSSLPSIGDLPACTNIGERAFNGCSNLSSMGDLSVCTSIGERAFEGCSSLDHIIISSDQVPTIEGKIGTETTIIFVKNSMLGAFKGADIWSSFANRIISLDAQTEYDINVVSPATASGIYNEIGEENLGNVLSLKLSGDINGYDFFILRNRTLNLRSIDMSNVRIVAAEDNYSYYDGHYTENDVFPQYAFSGKSNITSIKLPSNITEIGSNALTGTKITEVEIPASVRKIGERSFADCNNLTQVTMSEGLNSLEYGAFEGCI